MPKSRKNSKDLGSVSGSESQGLPLTGKGAPCLTSRARQRRWPRFCPKWPSEARWRLAHAARRPGLRSCSAAPANEGLTKSCSKAPRRPAGPQAECLCPGVADFHGLFQPSSVLASLLRERDTPSACQQDVALIQRAHKLAQHLHPLAGTEGLTCKCRQLNALPCELKPILSRGSLARSYCLENRFGTADSSCLGWSLAPR